MKSSSLFLVLLPLLVFGSTEAKYLTSDKAPSLTVFGIDSKALLDLLLGLSSAPDTEAALSEPSSLWSLLSEEELLSAASLPCGWLSSLEDFDKTAKSFSNFSARLSRSPWPASARANNSFPFWSRSLIGLTTEGSCFESVERRALTSSTSLLKRLLSTVAAFSSAGWASLFAEGSLATSAWFSSLACPASDDCSPSFGLARPVVDDDVFWLGLSALTTLAPINIRAATATEAAPKLYLRIEKRKTFSRWWRFTLLSEFDLSSMLPP